jgi:hypothetical protein
MFSGARWRGLADSLRRRLSHRQNKCRRDEAERTGEEEGREIRREYSLYRRLAELQVRLKRTACSGAEQ